MSRDIFPSEAELVVLSWRSAPVCEFVNRRVLTTFQKISFLPSGEVSERPGAVKGAFFAAKRTLDREDRSGRIPRGKECLVLRFQSMGKLRGLLPETGQAAGCMNGNHDSI